MHDLGSNQQCSIPRMVSTVITSYNKGPYLGEAIDSALRQDYTPQEIIVIDDGSTDNTRSIAAEFGGRIRYFYQENRGQASAKNRGIREAHGEFIAFLDGDDRWREDKLSRQMPLFEGRPQLAVVYAPKTPFSDRTNGPDWACRVPTERLRRGSVLDAILVDNFVPFSSAVVRRSALRQVGMLDEEYRIAVDYDLWLRMAREYEFDFVEEPLVQYWEGENRIGAQFGTKFEHVMRIQEAFLSRFYPEGFPNPAVVRAATARKYAEHGDWLVFKGRQLAAFRAHLSAVWWEPRRAKHYFAMIRDLIPNRLAPALKRWLPLSATLTASTEAR